VCGFQARPLADGSRCATAIAASALAVTARIGSAASRTVPEPCSRPSSASVRVVPVGRDRRRPSRAHYERSGRFEFGPPTNDSWRPPPSAPTPPPAPPQLPDESPSLSPYASTSTSSISRSSSPSDHPALTTSNVDRVILALAGDAEPPPIGGCHVAERARPPVRPVGSRGVALRRARARPGQGCARSSSPCRAGRSARCALLESVVPRHRQ